MNQTENLKSTKKATKYENIKYVALHQQKLASNCYFKKVVKHL